VSHGVEKAERHGRIPYQAHAELLSPIFEGKYQVANLVVANFHCANRIACADHHIHAQVGKPHLSDEFDECDQVFSVVFVDGRVRMYVDAGSSKIADALHRVFPGTNALDDSIMNC
jgi:hypothetical protein